MIDPGQIPDATTPYVLVTHPKQWEDKYAEVYTSPLRLWGINLGLTINI
jgi:hypothetical protein